MPDSIGTAQMDADGTITLYLRSENADGTIGEAKLTYRPGSKDYAYVLNHLGEIKPGQTRPVKPFPDSPPRVYEQEHGD